MKVLTIARVAFLEARKRWLFWAVALMSLAFLCLFAVGFYFIHRDMRQASRPLSSVMMEANSNILLLIGLYAVNFLVVVLAVLTSVDTIAGEISSGTIQTIVTKPLHRWEVVLGKWLGLAIMLAAFTVIMGVALMGIVWAIADYLPPHPGDGLLLMVVEGLVVLAISILGGTRLNTLTNGVVVFMLYALAFIGGWVEQIGAFTGNDTSVYVGIISSLIMPSEAIWRRAAYLMQPPFIGQLGIGPFVTVSPPSTAMVVYTILYMGAALVLAMVAFQRRDL